MTNANQNVFDQNTSSNSEANDNVATASNTNASDQYTSDLVGDGKKFKTVADLEKGKTEADAFIEQLKTEKEQLLEDLNKRATIEESLEQLKAGQSSEDNTNSAVDADKLAQLVIEQVTKLDTDKVKTANITETNDKLVELFGDKAGETLVSKANELGVSVEFLKSTAATSPAAFYNLVGIQLQSGQTSVARTPMGHNTQAINNGSGSKDWSYYENLRKENPRVYHSPAIQNEMFLAQKEGRL